MNKSDYIISNIDINIDPPCITNEKCERIITMQELQYNYYPLNQSLVANAII